MSRLPLAIAGLGDLLLIVGLAIAFMIFVLWLDQKIYRWDEVDKERDS